MAGEERQIIIDPSSLTTQQLWREIGALKELLGAQIEAVEKAIKVAHDDLVRVPTDVQKQVGNLRELHEEKFRSIQVQFAERDVRSEQSAKDTKVAVDAALSAAEKSREQQNQSFALGVAKSEAGITKQIEQLGTLIQATSRALDDKISDAKDRLTRIESRGEGEKGGRMSQQQLMMMIVSLIISFLIIGGAVVSVTAYMVRK